MGKIRVKTLGDEEQEKKDSKKTETDVIESPIPSDSPAPSTPSKPKKKDKFAKKRKSSRSKSYLAVAAKVDKDKLYKLSDALTLLPDLKISKFDETVELHLNTTEQGISGAVTLPHGSGKSTKVEIVNATADPKHVDEVIKKVEGGQIDFDVLVATPDTMPKLAKIARF